MSFEEVVQAFVIVGGCIGLGFMFYCFGCLVVWAVCKVWERFVR
jgi:hypothetical protein